MKNTWINSHPNTEKHLPDFEISAHNLEIERGRYHRPPTPSELRICPHCPSSIQDEFHFLFDCCIHDQDRLTMLNNVLRTCINFPELSLENKFFFLMNTEGDMLREVAKYVNKCLP